MSSPSDSQLKMARNNSQAPDRHASNASSGAESWTSQETIRGMFGSRRHTPVNILTDREARAESEISPGSLPNPQGKIPHRPSNMSSIAPWESQPTPDYDKFQKEAWAAESSAGPAPAPAPAPTRRPPQPNASAAPGQRNGGIYTGFYDDSSEDMARMSPELRPGSSQEDMVVVDGRRPSVASATTISSVGSKSSVGRGFHKKRLNNFFGDDFPGLEAVTRQNSESSLPPGIFTQNGSSSGVAPPRQRNNSAGGIYQGSTPSQVSRPGSPSSMLTRPKTPSLSVNASEVTPWEFQEAKDSSAAPPQLEKTLTGKSAKHHHHLLHFPGHRHTRSREEERPIDPITPNMIRPSISREDSTTSFRRPDYSLSSKTSQSNLSSGLAPPRPPSPSPSDRSFSLSHSVKGHHKRSIFDVIRRKDKDRTADSSLLHLPGSSASLSQSKLAKTSKTDPSMMKKKSFAPESLPRVATANAKDAKGRIPFKSSKKQEPQGPGIRDPNHATLHVHESNSTFHLDTDFTDLSDIISTKPYPPTNDIFTGEKVDGIPETKPEPVGEGAWDAPDSWAVKRVEDENMARLKETSELDEEENAGPPFCLRIFRSDSTFAVLSVPLNTTVSEIVGLIRKKSFLSDETDNYIIVMRKHGLARQLGRNERPLIVQKKLLEQAGYTEADKIEDVGREDNSYLCRFTFLPQKSSGYAILEKDPELDKQQKFSYVDLQGKNLITIPVALHKRATEIISLNISRNLTIDVPKDFIQACSNLREIKFTSNETDKIPVSFSHAARLTMLDVSNNRIEELDHVELYRLHQLVSLRLGNNVISALPTYFGQFKSLRSLNLSSNSLQTFPEEIRELTALADLDISFNLIDSIPDISNLKLLERLWATNNRLSGSFPESTSALINLREIDVRHNSLDNINVLSELPKLEYLLVGYNHISSFTGSFQTVRALDVNNNPITRFDIAGPVPTLTSLNLSKAKLAALPDDLFQKIPNLIKLVLDKNHFVSLSPNLGKLTRLEYLSVAQNALSSLPPEMGRLIELRYLDLRENNLNSLPPQIWFAKRLETLNLSSNVLGSFPKPGAPMPALPEEAYISNADLALMTDEDFDQLGELGYRRPSAASGYQSGGSSSPGPQSRKGSIASTLTQARKPSLVSRGSESTINTFVPVSRKDSSLSNRLLTTFAGTLRRLYLADNRLQDEIFDELSLLPELRIVNLSYNDLYDLPPRTLRRWPHLDELYLSGNELRSLPAEDLDEASSLKVLHINCNKFQVLPAELAKVKNLAVMDVGSNLLKYNVSNWPYDWNWNWNYQLKYLNLSGNTRLEIKPAATGKTTRGDKDLTDFSSLIKLRVLGLMDVTIRSTVPDQTEDRRVRTAGSQVGYMSYGMADCLGKNEHLSTMDMVVDRFRSHEDETLIGMFDGDSLGEAGSRISKYLYENFRHRFADELEKLRNPETAIDALRRTYLALNKEIAIAITHAKEKNTASIQGNTRLVPIIPDLNDDDLISGCVATVLFIKEMQLYVSNIGDATALLIDSEGGHKVITRKHDPTEPSERQRIREAGGFVSRNGKLNEQLEVSRAFGYIQHSPAVIASPHVSQITVTENHEMILIASREMWKYMSKDFAVDMARSERGDLMRAAQKLRDLAIAFGASSKIMVMVVGVSDLKKRERQQFRSKSWSMSPSGLPEDFLPQAQRRGRRDKNAVYDSKLARLDQEVEPPVGQVSLVFTDIKNSTLLWETYPIAMRSAIRMHNELMRRQLRIIGGYEVKTEGDAFMVSFPTVTSALLWAFTVQIQLLEVQWPTEILSCVHGQETLDPDGNVIFKGLSVRMGMHWGAPVCEVDPVTKRMDYFGPMVNRSSRISSVADGGQITVSEDFIKEIQRLLETNVESERNGSIDSDEIPGYLGGGQSDEPLAPQIRRELRNLSSQGFEVKELGERRLKGLENPEYIYLMYPHALSGRLAVQQQRAEAAEASISAPTATPGSSASTKAVLGPDGELAFDVDNVWALCQVALRLEALCNTLENPGSQGLIAPDTALLEQVKENGGEMTDSVLLNIVSHQVSRVETCINTLVLRNMMRPFVKGMAGTACPISDIFGELASQLTELKAMKRTLGLSAIEPLGAISPSVEELHHDTDDADSLSAATITPRATPTPTPMPAPSTLSLNS